MQVFPQLTTGVAALYPVLRKNVTRSAVNDLADGSQVVFGDPDAATKEWELRANGFSLEESTAIEALFQAMSGRLTTFTFLDPAGNLLPRSEEFGAPEWDNSPLMQLTPGVTDPFGTARATHVVNAGSTDGFVAQSLAVPGKFRYVLSTWARTTAGSNVTLSATTLGGSVTQRFELTNQWRRVFAEVRLGLDTDSVVFGARLEAGALVDLFGMQVEAQPGVSDYKKTGGSGGVYTEARFAEDELTLTAKGTDIFDAVIRLVAS